MKACVDGGHECEEHRETVERLSAQHQHGALESCFDGFDEIAKAAFAELEQALTDDAMIDSLSRFDNDMSLVEMWDGLHVQLNEPMTGKKI